MRLATAVAILLMLAGFMCEKRDFQPCYGLERHDRLSLHIVENASSTGFYQVEAPESFRPYGLPSCDDFDAFGAGVMLDLSNVALANKSNSGCSTPLADVQLPDGTFLATTRGEAGMGLVGLFGGGSGFAGVAVAARADVAGCPGTWVLSTSLGELQSAYDVYSVSEHWSDDMLFDRLAEGGPPPVVAVRYFSVADGASCPALGVTSGPYECRDVFSGYLLPSP